jgi:hypothetical protein
MGVIKFRLPPSLPPSRLADLRRAYVTGLDRTPGRVRVEIKSNLLLATRDVGESARLSVPWPVPGAGTPILSTATLSERNEPYNLAVELARGRLNEVRNQVADWRQMGLTTTPALDDLLQASRRSFVAAATRRDALDESFKAAQESLSASCEAGHLVASEYTTQVLQNRLSASPKLPTLLAGVVEDDPMANPWGPAWSELFNAAHVPTTWKALEPSEGKYRWDELDARLAWCRKRQIPIQAGPLVEFRAGSLPDWIWLWEGDFDAILDLVVSLVKQTVGRYKGQIPVWNLVHRPATTGLLGLSEEEQVRITARAIQVARQADPAAQFVIGFDRPWAEWMGSSPFQLGPLHLADYLARADLGLAGLALEIAPGYSAPGSHLRDLFDFSRLLDLYALLNLPLHLTIAVPSSSKADPRAEANVTVEESQWPGPVDEAAQLRWASEWFALAVAKPFVRSVTWGQMSDGMPNHLFPNAGLYRVDKTPKPTLDWLRSFRAELLA